MYHRDTSQTQFEHDDLPPEAKDLSVVPDVAPAPTVRSAQKLRRKKRRKKRASTRIKETLPPRISPMMHRRLYEAVVHNAKILRHSRSARESVFYRLPIKFWQTFIMPFLCKPPCIFGRTFLASHNHAIGLELHSKAFRKHEQKHVDSREEKTWHSRFDLKDQKSPSDVRLDLKNEETSDILMINAEGTVFMLINKFEPFPFGVDAKRHDAKREERSPSCYDLTQDGVAIAYSCIDLETDSANCGPCGPVCNVSFTYMNGKHRAHRVLEEFTKTTVHNETNKDRDWKSRQVFPHLERPRNWCSLFPRDSGQSTLFFSRCTCAEHLESLCRQFNELFKPCFPTDLMFPTLDSNAAATALSQSLYISEEHEQAWLRVVEDLLPPDNLPLWMSNCLKLMYNRECFRIWIWFWRQTEGAVRRRIRAGGRTRDDRGWKHSLTEYAVNLFAYFLDSTRSTLLTLYEHQNIRKTSYGIITFPLSQPPLYVVPKAQGSPSNTFVQMNGLLPLHQTFRAAGHREISQSSIINSLVL